MQEYLPPSKYYHFTGPVDYVIFDNDDGKDSSEKHVTGEVREKIIVYEKTQANPKGAVQVIVSEQELLIDGWPQPKLIVPGSIISREGNRSEVKEIVDPKARDELTKLIRDLGLQGPIHFSD